MISVSVVGLSVGLNLTGLGKTDRVEDIVVGVMILLLLSLAGPGIACGPADPGTGRAGGLLPAGAARGHG